MRVVIPLISILLVASRAVAADLPGAAKLDWEGDLSARMVEGIDRFLMREIEKGTVEREQFWDRDFSTPEAYEKSIEPNRARLRRMLGVIDQRVPVEAIEFLASTGTEAMIAQMDAFAVFAVRWPVFERVHGEGLWLRPTRPNGAWVIALPDADQTPEMLAGLAMGVAHEQQFARRLAEAGCEVFIPVLINRSDRLSGNAELNRFTNQPHREWIYRQAYQMGRHIIGYEVQKVLALVDWIRSHGNPGAKLGLAGYGEGALLTLYSAALDPRIDAALVSGYFAARESLWEEPIYRNVFGLLREFGDAELAGMVAPRALVVEYSVPPLLEGPPPPRDGRRGAAPGRIRLPERWEVEEEINRALGLFPREKEPPIHLVYGNEGAPLGPGSSPALKHFGEALGISFGFQDETRVAPEPQEEISIDPAARQERQLQELVDFTQNLLERSERVRNREFWQKAAGATAEDWPMRSAEFKRRLWEEVLGKFDNPFEPLRPRARKTYEREEFTGYEVVLDVWPGVFAWGILLLPNDLAPGEKRPVVVCQHGLEGLPADTIEGEGSPGYQYYKSFAAELARRGFITFAPHNPYRGRDKFRVLQRKANPLGKSLFSVILGQHDQLLNWLSTLPMVDPERIAFYGLSYGGKTAMRVPALLDRYCLSICSADFNEWIRKNVTIHSSYSYMFTIEYEMPEFNLGHTFNYAEMAALIAPRPFMVERGHSDGVAPDEWVAYEYAKVRRHYVGLGIPERTEIEFFDGPHTIHGEETFEFLHRHLQWPVPAEDSSP